MTIATGNVITKTDVVNAYNNKLATITNLINWKAANNPTFSGSAGTGSNVKSPSGYITNPSAFPSGQLSNTMPTTLATSSLSGKMVASTLYNLVYNAIQTASRVRYVTCIWMHTTNSTDSQIDKQQKYCLFNATTSAVSGSTRPYYTKSPNTTSMTGTISVGTNGVTAGSKITATNYNNLLNECYNKWVTFKNNNTVSYTYYTCHHNCHSNYSDRARR